jgi:hypothetical protein
LEKPFDSAAQNIALKAGAFTGKEANYHEICKTVRSAAQNIALKAGTFTGKEANYHEICSIWKNRSIVQPKTSR